MSWFFDGLGTFLIGLVLGAGGDRLYIRLLQKNRTTQDQRKRIVQRQKAANLANQVQIGDVEIPKNGN